ncbi:cysteine--tRNA ligase [Parafrankia sp. BMG5.11]|uniref:cysteine--tRNA ligase n=1 Tax=Parafrankia sp. BMG5.11 TaxID=222540 RepID=UPI001040B48C|nr:cysteine--tRNA ligase [Parafrankia sp. BMG5.11]TCJ37184.1 cysteine--tRNA ligase [Parafrankia sp. BMG5.11]
MTDLKLFNSLTRSLETFQPIHPGEARVYSCGPTVYNYQHVGNMRAYVFADTLGRVLSFKGYDLRHVINITDVGHLTSDADAGDDKMEKAAASQGKSAWDIARHYQSVFEEDLARLNIRKPQHPRATDYVEAMIAWGKAIEDKHCYRLDSGLYFDVTTVPDYGRLARASTDEGESRIDTVEGKRHAADFAIWRTTPAGENRQMEWDSPWGRGAPGWHIECSVMSAELLGHPFDIHTGGIDHREIHHPNEIAQNQAHACGPDTGARIWMHNNFLVDRRRSGDLGKMSKSTGDFLTLQALVDRGYHPLAYRLLCLQAHYRSELEFTWDGLTAALARLNRIALQIERLRASTAFQFVQKQAADGQLQGLRSRLDPVVAKFYLQDFERSISEDLNTPKALPIFEQVLQNKKISLRDRVRLSLIMDQVLGLGVEKLSRKALRIRPKHDIRYAFTNREVDSLIHARKILKSRREFSASDLIRDLLTADGVGIMDGDPLGWEWKL